MTRILAIDCATEACSVALFEETGLIGFGHKVIGRGHAEQLVPMIAALPEKGKASQIIVSRGPGSFTGVRIGIAAAQALAFAWSADILAYPTLALIAAMAQEQKGAEPVLACMTGGHGEWFAQDFTTEGLPAGNHMSLTPEIAVTSFATPLVAGTQAVAFVERRGSGCAIPSVPDARHALTVPECLLTTNIAPLYGRAPDANVPK